MFFYFVYLFVQNHLPHYLSRLGRVLLYFAGELLKLAAELLREGLHTAEILEGYSVAYIKAQEILPSLVCHTVTDVRDAKQLAFAIKAVIGSKQYGFEVCRQRNR